jgi:hypothetical protein
VKSDRSSLRRSKMSQVVPTSNHDMKNLIGVSIYSILMLKENDGLVLPHKRQLPTVPMACSHSRDNVDRG